MTTKNYFKIGTGEKEYFIYASSLKNAELKAKESGIAKVALVMKLTFSEVSKLPEEKLKSIRSGKLVSLPSK